MKIIIDEKYKLESDSVGYVVSKYSKGTISGGKYKGQKYANWKEVGYYSSIETALKGLLETMIKSSEAISIRELGRDIESFKMKINSLLTL